MGKLQHFRIKTLFLFAILSLLTLSFLSYSRIDSLIEESKWVNHTNLVKLSLEKTYATLSEKESNLMGYIFTNDTVFLSPYFAADTSIISELNTIDSLTKDNPLQQQNLVVLQTAINERMEMMKHNLVLFNTKKLSIPDRLKGKALMDTVRTQIDEMKSEEDKLLSFHSAAFSKSVYVTPLITIVLIIGSLAILIAAYLQITHEQKISIALTSNVEQKTNELIQANKELTLQNVEKEKRAAELIISNKELESFNYISSHDLQEPLRKIQAFSSRLIDNESANLSAKGKEYVIRMQDAANRMQTLIADLLAYSRTATSERKFETINLNTLIDSVKKDFAETIAEKNVIIEVAEMCDAHIIPFQFRQLIDNIISNSIKFAKPDLPPHIIIKSRIINGSEVNNQKLLSEKKYCHITITDNGIGFEPKYKDRIFEVFQRLHDKTKIPGTGIGLAIVKKIVENHNGLITATSELYKGATFDIYLPAS